MENEFGPDLDVRLEAAGLEQYLIPQVAAVARSSEEALSLATDLVRDGGRTGRQGGWREWFSAREQRCYYVHQESGDNGWDPPLLFIFLDCQLESQLHSISLREARRLFDTVQFMISSQPFIGGGRQTAVQCAVQILAKILGNIAGCGNTEPKFRTLKMGNPKISGCIVGVPGASEVLQAAGFKIEVSGSEQAFVLGPEADLGVIGSLHSRLERLRDNKGHSGDAKYNDDLKSADSSGSGLPAASPFHGQPGFRFQTLIYHCAVCNKPIPDGSERLWTRSFDSPHGQFRYECQHCEAFNFCEGCWDSFQQGEIMHEPTHTFQAHHPVTTRHNTRNAPTSASNPWGVVRGDGAAAARAYNRLMGRTGGRR